MLTDKSADSTKPRAKSSKSSPARASVAAAVKSGNTNKVASPQAVYATRGQRRRSERSMFSVLLAQSGPSSDMEMVNLVHNRLPLTVIDRLLAEGVTKQEIDLV